MTNNTTETTKKKTGRAKKSRRILLSIGIITLNFVIAAALLVGAFYWLKDWLNDYTQHGIEIDAPNITGLYVEEAQALLESEGLQLQIIDTIFSNKTSLGTFTEQSPKEGTKVKKGRTIYATLNANVRRPIIMPEVRDMSLRQAETLLKSLGLEIGSIHYEPSTYKNIILDLRVNEVPIKTGSELPEGTVVDLYVGMGLSEQQVTVPSVIGLNLNDVRTLLIANSLTIGHVSYDEEFIDSKADKYIVYQQTPINGSFVQGGTAIDMKLSLDIEKTVTTDSSEEEEEFF